MQDQGEQKDRQLWAALKKGNEKALSDLFLAYAESLYNYGYMLCRKKELVEETTTVLSILQLHEST